MLIFSILFSGVGKNDILNAFSQLFSEVMWSLKFESATYPGRWELRAAAAPSCSTSAPTPRSWPGAPGSPLRLRLLQGRWRRCPWRAALGATPGWGSPDSRWPAAGAAPPAPPWRAGARWWGCTSRTCSPWSGSSACGLWATTARRGCGTARTWGSSAAGPAAETPEPPCRGTASRSRSSLSLGRGASTGGRGVCECCEQVPQLEVEEELHWRSPGGAGWGWGWEVWAGSADQMHQADTHLWRRVTKRCHSRRGARMHAAKQYPCEPWGRGGGRGRWGYGWGASDKHCTRLAEFQLRAHTAEVRE